MKSGNSLQKSNPVDRLELDNEDKRLIRKWAGGSGFTADVASNVQKQGWISDKQRAVLRKDGQRGVYRSRGRYLYKENYGDFSESDYDIGAYELCVDGYGD